MPDFRSATGLYNRKNDSKYSPEYMLSHEFFINHPDEFMTYCKENLMLDGIKPNKAHYALAKLEKMGKLKAIITQNVDSPVSYTHLVYILTLKSILYIACKGRIIMKCEHCGANIEDVYKRQILNRCTKS